MESEIDNLLESSALERPDSESQKGSGLGTCWFRFVLFALPTLTRES